MCLFSGLHCNNSQMGIVPKRIDHWQPTNRNGTFESDSSFIVVMTSVAERLDIADRLRGISLANSRRVDVEADAPDRAVVTDGWIRKWDQQKGEYFWENPKMSVITHENPFLFESPSTVPSAMANQWFKVFDEKEQKNYYVNPTLSKEQWNKPVESAETVQLVKAHYMEEYAVEHFNRKHGWLHGEESVAQDGFGARAMCPASQQRDSWVHGWKEETRRQCGTHSPHDRPPSPFSRCPCWRMLLPTDEAHDEVSHPVCAECEV